MCSTIFIIFCKKYYYEDGKNEMNKKGKLIYFLHIILEIVFIFFLLLSILALVSLGLGLNYTFGTPGQELYSIIVFLICIPIASSVLFCGILISLVILYIFFFHTLKQKKITTNFSISEENIKNLEDINQEAQFN
jgi:hypothetical protein